MRRLLLSLGIACAPASLSAQHPFQPSGDFDVEPTAHRADQLARLEGADAEAAGL